ncbi:MAG TPA: TolC family protein [Patescibacteria group bacterium]|nr:TolC family protein [Patescibacteria group bacterium]
MASVSRSLIVALFGFSMLLAPGAAPARAQAPRTITLDQAIRLALARNPSMRAARSLIAQSRAGEVTANLRPNPVLTGDAMFIPIFQPSQLTAPTINNISEFDLGASYLFERGKKRQHRLAAARDLTAVTRSQVADSQRGLIYSVAQQFIGVLLAESTLSFAKRDLASFRHTLTINQARYKAGDISDGDFLKIKLQMLQVQTDVSGAELARMQSLNALRQLVGYESVPAGYDVSGSLGYQPLAATAGQLQTEALALRPDLRAARQSVTAAQSQYDLAKANGKQDVTLTFDYTHVSALNNGTFFWNIPLPIFNRNQGEIARTQAAIMGAQDSEIAARQAVLADVASAYDAVESEAQVVKLYQSGYLDEARESRNISEYAYQRGGASLLDLLDAERSYRAIRLGYLQALAAYQLSLEQLREAVGTRRLP